VFKKNPNQKQQHHIICIAEGGVAEVLVWIACA
jgi:hypothetical protein